MHESTRTGISRTLRRPDGARRGGRSRSPGAPGRAVIGALAVLPLLSGGCATQGDFLRLQEKVAEHHRPDREAPDPFARIAQLSSEVDALRQEVRDAQGELEVARRQAKDALEEARLARAAVAAQSSGMASTGATPNEAGGEGGGGVAAAGVAVEPDAELAGYQAALDAWRADDYPSCIDRFTAFLQAYPTSGYADDAAYWLADCTYKNAEFKRAVVRFNAVVSVYPESPKAPDALYRQGESLLKLGPKFHEAARTVFKRVQKDYPDSERAAEAQQQLERLGPGKQTG
jgi:tol-pal system protein YbgF